MERFEPMGPQSSSESKISTWKKFEQYGKIAALSTLLSLLGAEFVLGQEKGEQEDVRAKIEHLKQRAAEYEKNIIAAAREKGQAGNMNATPVRRLQSPDGKIVTTVGYSLDEKTVQWFIHEGDDAAMRFFDKDADGAVDRVVINKENPKFGARQKAAFNDLKTFDSMQHLASEASVSADLEPEHVMVYEIRLEDQGLVVQAVDFRSGEASELTGSDAEKLISQVQGSFTNSIEGVSGKLKASR